jgi:hypothetical protein
MQLHCLMCGWCGAGNKPRRCDDGQWIHDLGVGVFDCSASPLHETPPPSKPDWLKAGVVINPEHFVTYPPKRREQPKP